MRNKMQDAFGNAGFGFTFPYSVAKTNNSAPVRFTASGDFQSVRNLYADRSKPVGLSGIALETTSSDFSIQLEVKDPKYNFTSLKIITPQNADLFDVSVSSKNTIIETFLNYIILFFSARLFLVFNLKKVLFKFYEF